MVLRRQGSQAKYTDFVRLVHRGICASISKMQTNRRELASLKENPLTLYMLGPLTGMGFDASFDKSSSGHCDITVEAFGVLTWLGEAKIYRSRSWLAQGYDQLTTRYAAGGPFCSTGGLIIYDFDANCSARATQWEDHFVKTYKLNVIDRPADSPSSFTSECILAGTGTTYSVRHFFVPLHYAPVVKLPTSAPKGKKAKTSP